MSLFVQSDEMLKGFYCSLLYVMAFKDNSDLRFYPQDTSG